MQKEREPQPHKLTIKEIAVIAKENLLRDGSHIPTIIVQGSGGTVAVQVAALVETPQGRRRQMYDAGVLLAQQNVVAVLWQIFYIAEGWMSQLEVGEMPAHAPSQDPKRKEILFVFHCDLTGSQATNTMRMWEMIRNSERKLVNLMEREQSGSAQGSLIDDFVAGYAVGLLGNFNTAFRSPGRDE